MRKRIKGIWMVMACWVGVAMLFAGCGTGGSEAPNSSIEEPSKPTVEACDFSALSRHLADEDGKVSTKRDKAPQPGIYSYAMAGKQVVPGGALRVKNLPSHSGLFVTPARMNGSESCFRIQMRFSPDIANTSTYVIRGEDVYLVSLLTQALGESQEITPNPPVLSASGSGSKWSGQFGGRTYGGYSFSALGKRTFQIGNNEVRTAGISSSVSYRGAFNGTQAVTAWIALRPNPHIVVSEELESRQDFGVSTLKINAHSRLMSLKPKQESES
jgi:hypothetical protein